MIDDTSPAAADAARETRRATREGLGVALATSAYGVSFGALAVASGLDVWQTCVLSLVMFTGGSQFAFVGVIGAGGLAAAPAAIASASLLGVRNVAYAMRMVPLMGELPPGSIAVVVEPEKVRRRAHDLEETNAEFLAAAWATASDGGAAPVDLSGEVSAELESAGFRSLTETRTAALANDVAWWAVTSLNQDEETVLDIDTLTINAREPRGYQGDVQEMMDFIGSRVRDGWKVVVVTEGPGPAARLAELFHEHDLPAARVDSLDTEPQAGIIEITTASAGRGFVFDSLKTGLLTEADLLGRATAYSTRDMRKMPSRRRNAVDPLQLREGDFVVHEQHGIGKFKELIQRATGAGANKTVREYLVLEYAPAKRGAPGDRLFVPTDQLDQITRYVGGDVPVLSKM